MQTPNKHELHRFKGIVVPLSQGDALYMYLAGEEAIWQSYSAPISH